MDRISTGNGCISDRIYSIADGLVLESGTGRIVKKKAGASLQEKPSDNAEKTQKLFYSLESIITCYESGERKIYWGKKEIQMQRKKRRKRQTSACLH